MRLPFALALGLGWACGTSAPNPGGDEASAAARAKPESEANPQAEAPSTAGGPKDSGLAASLLELAGQGDSTSPADQFLDVDDALKRPELVGKRVKVRGRVQAGSLMVKAGTEYRFVVARDSAELTVNYTGRLPDTFVEEAEVIVGGTLQEPAVLDADEVMAKCPDDYEIPT